jgi:serine protease Do
VRLDEAGAKPGAEGASLSAERQSLGELGMVVSPLQAEDQRRLKIAHGVLIRDASGAAEHAGVRAGDVLLALGTKSVTSIADAVQAAHGAGNTVAALIQHGRDKRYVPLLLK